MKASRHGRRDLSLPSLTLSNRPFHRRSRTRMARYAFLVTMLAFQFLISLLSLPQYYRLTVGLILHR